MFDLHSFSFGLSGVACLTFTLCASNLQFQLAGAFYGFAMSGWCVLTTLMLIELNGIDKLTSNMGLLVMVRGLTATCGPPLGGMVYETFGSYNYTFIFIGVYYLGASVLGEIAHFCNTIRVKQARSQGCNRWS